MSVPEYMLKVGEPIPAELESAIVAQAVTIGDEPVVLLHQQVVVSAMNDDGTGFVKDVVSTLLRDRFGARLWHKGEGFDGLVAPGWTLEVTVAGHLLVGQPDMNPLYDGTMEHAAQWHWDAGRMSARKGGVVVLLTGSDPGGELSYSWLRASALVEPPTGVPPR